MEDGYFEFSHYVLEGNIATFSYRLKSPNGALYEFNEILTFPTLPNITPNPILLDKALSAVHLALGISYYKLYCPAQLKVTSTKLSKGEADFWKIIYTESEIMQLYHGFNLDFDDKGNFPFEDGLTNEALSSDFKDRALILFGGGKDSLVTYDIIKKSGEETMFFDFGRFNLHDAMADKLNTSRIVVERTIDPLLIELNTNPGVYSGRKAHVPIPTMIAFVAVLTAVLFDYKYVVFSNEESAEYGNTIYKGREVNHQWSKSKRAEKLIAEYIKSSITPDISCFSLLRPFHEIEIVRRFAQTPEYFPMFSSCNRNFTLEQGKLTKLWCCQCEKCAFVFALLAAFLPKSQMISIFGENLYDNESLIQTYKDLLGIGTMKPFECVGTPEETIVAFDIARVSGEYDKSPVMKMYQTSVLPNIDSIDAMSKKVFSYGDDSLIPERFKSLLT